MKIKCDDTAIAILDVDTGTGVSVNFNSEEDNTPDVQGLVIELFNANGTLGNTVDLQELLQSYTMYLANSEVIQMKKELHNIADAIYSEADC